ncbi:MAG: HAMP domain-containing protein, partial [bacterium]|nr:HAMP domain-containing protein [bacterium]
MNTITGKQEESKDRLMETAGKMKILRASVFTYLDGNKPYNELESEYRAFVDYVRSKKVFDDKSKLEKLTAVSKKFQSIETVIKQNAELEKQIKEAPAKAEEGGSAEEAPAENVDVQGLLTQYVENSKKINGTQRNILNIFGEMFHYVNEQTSGATASRLKSVRDMLYVLFAFVIVMIVILLILSLGMIKLITVPLIAFTGRAYDLAVGDVDMTKRLHVDSKDEIGELGGWFNKFLDRLHQLLVKVKNSSTDIHNATEEITHASGDLASRTNEQASSITETSTTVEEFTTSVQGNTENSAEADMMLTSFNEEIQEKKSLIENVDSTMTEIFDSSKQIDNIIKVINDISFQTNLLALNAAVEAARAGEAGRGFAVVAAEVRNLAQKTAESSKSIQDIVMSNVESTQKGVQLVKDTSAFFAEVVEMMGETVTKISHITNSSREQSTGIEQINKAIGHMDEVSTHNAGLVEQLSATARNVKSNAVQLEELVSQFKLDDSSDVKGSDYLAEVKKEKKKEKQKKEEKKVKPVVKD